MSAALAQAFALLWTLDQHLLAVVGLSLRVSLTALGVGALLGLPAGAWLAVHSFAGRGLCLAVLNALMGLPSVVVGVIVYLLLSRSGPLGGWGLLFSPTAMIVAQSLLVTPLIAAVSRQIIEDAWRGYQAEFSVFKIRSLMRMKLLLMDCRHSLAVAVLLGLGRTLSEVGAVMIVGGNIEGYTRVMTTTIALETSKGDLPLSLALGCVLMMVILALNALAQGLQRKAERT